MDVRRRTGEQPSRTERGAGLAEYGLLLLLVLLVCIAALTALGAQISGLIDTANAMF